jgi:hypothetical protein
LPEKARRRKGKKMASVNSYRRNYVLASLVGAIGGGLAVALVTRAIPMMMKRMMCNMMAQMGNDSLSPEEM